MNIKKHIAEINRNGFSKIENVFTKKECEEYIKKSEKLFSKKCRGTRGTRFFSQLCMIFSPLGREGGLFLVIGKKISN